MLEIRNPKHYKRFYQIYYNGYTEQYVAQRNLFLVKNKYGQIKYMVRSYVDYAKEIVNTDHVLIVGNRIAISSPNKDLEKFLNEYISTPYFQSLLDKYIIQGLVLGDSMLRFSLQDGLPMIDVVNLVDVSSYYLLEGLQKAGYAIEYTAYVNDAHAHFKEIYLPNETHYIIDGEETILKHDDGISWLIHVPNRPSLQYGVWGESDLEIIYEAIDSINSTFARIDAIEDIYAKPKLIASGIRDLEFREHDNFFAVNENAEIQILEYKGQVIPAMLDKIKFLENYLKETMPELMLSSVKELTGYALKLKMIKLIKKIQTYRRVYFNGLKQILTLVAKYSGFENISFDFVLDDVIPNNELEDINKLLLLYNIGVLSRKSISEKLGIDYELEAARKSAEPPLTEVVNLEDIDNKLKSPAK